MLPALPRPDFLRLLIFGSSRFDQRTALGQVALALGCETPAHAGWYLYLDAIAVMLTSMFKATGLQLKPAADAVREHWEAWLELVTQAERKPIFGSRGEQVRAELFFAVATMFDRSHRVAVGETQDITTALGKADQPLHAVGFVSIHRVLHQLRANAEIAKPKLRCRKSSPLRAASLVTRPGWPTLLRIGNAQGRGFGLWPKRKANVLRGRPPACRC